MNIEAIIVATVVVAAVGLFIGIFLGVAGKNSQWKQTNGKLPSGKRCREITAADADIRAATDWPRLSSKEKLR